MEKKRTKNKPRNVKCTMCGTTFLTTHSQGKYCSPECKREGKRAGWRKYGKRNRRKRRIYYKRYYEANIKQISERIRLYQQSPDGKKAQRNSDINQRRKSPEKYQAHQEVLKALRNGTLIKLPCKFCGVKQVEAHHPDYSEPLEVIWLCSECHRLLHKILKEKEVK